MSAQVLRINFVVVALAELVIVPLTREILDFGANTLIGVCLVAAIVVIVLEVVIPAWYVVDLWAGMMINVIMGTVTGVVTGSGVDVLPTMAANIWAATMTALAFVPMLSLSEEALPFGCEACNCWPTAARNGRALHARMPSCQV